MSDLNKENYLLNGHGLKKEYRVGQMVTGIVEHHASFGIFLDIGEKEFKGVVRIVDLSDSQDIIYPSIGEEVNAVVLGFRNEKEFKQIYLSTKPSLLAQADKTK